MPAVVKQVLQSAKDGGLPEELFGLVQRLIFRGYDASEARQKSELIQTWADTLGQGIYLEAL